MSTGRLELKILNASDKAAEARHRVVVLEKTVNKLLERLNKLERAFSSEPNK